MTIFGLSSQSPSVVPLAQPPAGKATQVRPFGRVHCRGLVAPAPPYGIRLISSAQVPSAAFLNWTCAEEDGERDHGWVGRERIAGHCPKVAGFALVHARLRHSRERNSNALMAAWSRSRVAESADSVVLSPCRRGRPCGIWRRRGVLPMREFFEAIKCACRECPNCWTLLQLFAATRGLPVMALQSTASRSGG